VAIEELNLSEKCIKDLKRAGFITVEDIVMILKSNIQMGGAWLKCFDPLLEQLKSLGFWSDELENLYPLA
jgi:hypothetical protein